jgi:hypothetical protein
MLLRSEHSLSFFLAPANLGMRGLTSLAARACRKRRRSASAPCEELPSVIDLSDDDDDDSNDDGPVHRV